MANAPDIRIRLSAEGVDEVVRALGKVQAQAQKAGQGAGKGIGVLNQALGDLQGILPHLGIAAAVTGLGAMVKSAIDTADNIGKLAQKTGVSTEAISVLNFAAQTADASFEQLSKGLIKFNKTMSDLDKGSAEAGASVRKLFGSAQALNNLPTEQRLLKVIDKIGGLEAGYKKTGAAQAFFGKSGADLIPLFNDLAEGGFAKAELRARAFGLVINKDFANAAQVANDSLKTLKLQAEGAATQFSAGLIPAIANSAQALTDAFDAGGAGQSGLKKMGEAVGAVAKGIVGAFLLVGKTIGFVLAEAENELGRFTDSLGVFFQFLKDAKNIGVKGAFSNADANARASRTARNDNAKSIKDFFVKDLVESEDKLFNKDATVAGISNQKKGGDGGNAPNTADVKAGIEAQKAALEQALALSQKYSDIEEQNTKQAYERGTESLEKYYEDRRVILLTANANEIATLKEKQALAQQQVVDNAVEQIKKTQEVDAIKSQIQLKELERVQKLSALNFEEGQKTEELNKRRLEIEGQILEAQGRTYEAAISAIQRQAAELKKSGVDPSTIDRLTESQTRQAGLKNMQSQGQGALNQLNNIQTGLQNQVTAGQLFPFEAVDRYNASVQAAIPSLRLYAEQQRAAAVTPEEIEAAAQYSLQVEGLAVSTDKAAVQLGMFKQSVEQSLTSDLTSFFTKGITEAESFGDAMRGLALSVVDSLRQIAAQMLATYATQQLLKAASAAFGGYSGGGLVQAADGGYIWGPGTGTSDSIPARLSKGEFVVRSAVVGQPGVLQHLSALNKGMGSPMLRQSGGVSRFADGGLVTAADAMGGAASGDVRVGLEDGLIAREVRNALKSKDGGRLIVEQIGQNQKSASRALGR